jgi:hypothetical protein
LEDGGEVAFVYGSLAWQYWAANSGLAYLTANSDADLLFRPMSWGAVLTIVGVLERFQRQFTPRVWMAKSSSRMARRSPGGKSRTIQPRCSQKE